MNDHISTERMNEALDGLLSSVETEPMERHVEECASCRNEYARLSETIAAIAALPKAATMPDGSWDVIAERIGEEAAGADDGDVPVYRLPTAANSSRRISFSIPELAAAALVVAFVSAALVWATIGGGGIDGTPTVLTAEAAPGGAAARAVSLEGDRYGQAVAGLERILEEGRPLLAPETLVSIEESLASLNAAIEEIETALADDPNSNLLMRMLSDRQRTKLGVLERAAAAVQAQT